jgi:hypothetical protein
VNPRGDQSDRAGPFQISPLRESAPEDRDRDQGAKRGEDPDVRSKWPPLALMGGRMLLSPPPMPPTRSSRSVFLSFLSLLLPAAFARARFLEDL